MAGKHLRVMSNAAIAGVLIAVFMAVLCLIGLNGVWWNIQNSYGHSMFHHLEAIVMGATYSQAFSLAIVLSLAAGALTAYLSRAEIRNDRSALLAGAFTGLIIAATICLASMVIMTLSSTSSAVSVRGESAMSSIWFNLGYIIANAPMVLFISLVLPALGTIPAAAAGAVIGMRSTTGTESKAAESSRPSGAILIATAVGIVIVGLMTVLLLLAYGVSPALTLLFSLPFLITMPLLADAVEHPHRIGPVPAVFVILGASVIAIVLLPIASVFLACQAGIIYSPPYEWEQDIFTAFRLTSGLLPG